MGRRTGNGINPFVPFQVLGKVEGMKLAVRIEPRCLEARTIMDAIRMLGRKQNRFIRTFYDSAEYRPRIDAYNARRYAATQGGKP